MSSHRLVIQSDPAEFLNAAGDLLAETPLTSTVVATAAHRAARSAGDGGPVDPDRWWLTVHDQQDRVVGAGMYQPPPGRRIAFLLPLPEGVAAQLAATLHARGQVLDGINGARPSVDSFAEEWIRLTGGEVSVAMHSRLFELGDLVTPPPARGELRAPVDDEIELLAGWFADFQVDATEQGGRPVRPADRQVPELDSVRQRVTDGRLWVWVVDGRPVHVTGTSLPAFGVARVAPVYTPKEHRGHGYAANAVAEVSRRLRDSGARVCLFTDQANPVSNPLYERLGFRAVVDMINLAFVSEQPG